MQAAVAASPEEKHRAPPWPSGQPSSQARDRWSASRVGFPLRLYS